MKLEATGLGKINQAQKSNTLRFHSFEKLGKWMTQKLRVDWWSLEGGHSEGVTREGFDKRYPTQIVLESYSLESIRSISNSLGRDERLKNVMLIKKKL